MMNTYSYSWKELEIAREEMEARQPFEIIISGWRAGSAYSFFKHFAAVENRTGGLRSALISSLLGFLHPGLALVAGQSRLSGYAITFRKHEVVTYITFHPEHRGHI
jgi:hypothetical protein